MRSRGLMMLLIAAIAGLAAVFLAARWMQGQESDNKGRIAVASGDIELGGRITADLVHMIDWPKTSVPAGAFDDAGKLDGRVVLVSVQRGEPITETRLAPVGTKGGLSAVVPPGKRAMTVRVNDVVGVAGFALPGTFVDVMVNTQDEGDQRAEPASPAPIQRDRSISKIVLERILVLAVAQEADRDSTKPKVVNAVTLAVTPNDAQMLDLARSVGTLSLVLRNQTDPATIALSGGATKAELLGWTKHVPERVSAPVLRAVAAPRAPVAVALPAALPVVMPVAVAEPPPIKSVDCVEIIRGSSRVTECF